MVNFEEWMERRYGGINYHFTQLLTDHSYFNAYLQRMRKMESAICVYCRRAIDNVEHTMMECEEWNLDRDALKAAINSAVNTESIVTALCSEEGWQAVNRFAQQVIGKKEEDEKIEQQRKRQEDRQRRAMGTEDGRAQTSEEEEQDVEDLEEWEQNSKG